MTICFEIKNKKLKLMLEKKARELDIPLTRLMWNYLNRGLMGDRVTEYDPFQDLHSDEFLKEVDDALGID